MAVVAAILGLAAKTDSCTWNISTTGDLGRTQETDCVLPDGGMYDCTGGPAPSSTATASSTPDAGTTTEAGTPAAVTVSVSPLNVTLGWNMSRQFTATVANTDQTAVAWTIDGGAPTGVTFDQSGLVTIGTTAQAGSSFTLRATSLADTTVFAETTVTISSVTLTISPVSAKLNPSGTQTFTGTTTGSSANLLWSVAEGDGGTIDPDSGLYTAPTTEGTYHVRLTDATTPNLYALATVTVMSGPLPSVTISPSTATLTAAIPSGPPSDTVPFAATVANDTNTAVTWTVSGTCGTLPTVSTAGVVTTLGTASCSGAVITATSVDDPSKSATATVDVVPVDSQLFTLYGTVALGAGVNATGPVYITVSGKYAGSTMLPAGLGTTGENFMIRAAPSDSQMTTIDVLAYMDTQGVQTFLPSVDPYVYVQETPGAATSILETRSLTLPTPPTLGTLPRPYVQPMDASLLVSWSGQMASIWTNGPSFEVADRYAVFLKQMPFATSTCDGTTVGPSVNDVTLTVPAGRGDLAVVNNLTNGDYYCVAVAASADGGPDFTTVAATNPYQVGALNGSGQLDATINVDYSSLASSLSTSPEPLLYTFAASNNDNVIAARSPVSGVSTSVYLNQLQDNQDYQLLGFVDTNADGWLGIDEPSFVTGFPPTFAVRGASPNPLNVTMSDSARKVSVTTSASGSTYGLDFVAGPNLAALAGARVDSMEMGATPVVSSPVDLSFNPAGMFPGNPGFSSQFGMSSPLGSGSTFHFLLFGLDGTVEEVTATQSTTLPIPTGLALATGAYSSKYLSPVDSTGNGVTTCRSGGTCSTSVAVATSYSSGTATADSYCVEITAGGAVGTAKFQVADASSGSCTGVTYNGTDVITSSSVALTATNIPGITTANDNVSLAFTGTGNFTANDVYQFRVTPGVTVAGTGSLSWNTNTAYSGYQVQLNSILLNAAQSNVGLNETGSTLAAGDYSATVTAFDNQGNSATSAPFSITVPVVQ